MISRKSLIFQSLVLFTAYLLPGHATPQTLPVAPTQWNVLGIAEFQVKRLTVSAPTTGSLSFIAPVGSVASDPGQKYLARFSNHSDPEVANLLKRKARLVQALKDEGFDPELATTSNPSVMDDRAYAAVALMDTDTLLQEWRRVLAGNLPVRNTDDLEAELQVGRTDALGLFLANIPRVLRDRLVGGVPRVLTGTKWPEEVTVNSLSVIFDEGSRRYIKLTHNLNGNICALAEYWRKVELYQLYDAADEAFISFLTGFVPSVAASRYPVIYNALQRDCKVVEARLTRISTEKDAERLLTADTVAFLRSPQRNKIFPDQVIPGSPTHKTWNIDSIIGTEEGRSRLLPQVRGQSDRTYGAEVTSAASTRAFANIGRIINTASDADEHLETYLSHSRGNDPYMASSGYISVVSDPPLRGLTNSGTTHFKFDTEDPSAAFTSNTVEHSLRLASTLDDYPKFISTFLANERQTRQIVGSYELMQRTTASNYRRQASMIDVEIRNLSDLRVGLGDTFVVLEARARRGQMLERNSDILVIGSTDRGRIEFNNVPALQLRDGTRVSVRIESSQNYLPWIATAQLRQILASANQAKVIDTLRNMSEARIKGIVFEGTIDRPSSLSTSFGVHLRWPRDSTNFQLPDQTPLGTRTQTASALRALGFIVQGTPGKEFVKFLGPLMPNGRFVFAIRPAFSENYEFEATENAWRERTRN